MRAVFGLFTVAAAAAAPSDWFLAPLDAASRLFFGEKDEPKSADGLHLPLSQWPAVSMPCFYDEVNGATPAQAGQASRASIVWTTAASEGADRAVVTSYKIWEVARVGEIVRHEFVDRFGALLARSHGDIAVMSPAIVPSASGGFDFFSRVFGTRGQDRFGSILWHSALGHDFAQVPHTLGAEVSLMTSRAQSSFGGEDPRALLGPGGTPLVIFNAKFTEGVPRSMFLADIAAGTVVQLRAPNVGDGTQKNWAPFWFDGALHFLYSAQPLTVLRCAANGDCACVFSAGPAGCTNLHNLAGFRLRLGSPLTEIGDSGVYFTALHSQVLAANAPGVLGYKGHFALLSTQPWGWLAVSSELTSGTSATMCFDPLMRSSYAEGIDYPTSALLLGTRSEGVLLGSHFNDGECALQQLVWDAPLVDFVANLRESACVTPVPGECVRTRHNHEVNDTAAISSHDVPCLTTSQRRTIGRCSAWATLGTLDDSARAQAIAPLRTLDPPALKRLLQGNETNCTLTPLSPNCTSPTPTFVPATPSSTFVPTPSATISATPTPSPLVVKVSALISLAVTNITCTLAQDPTTVQTLLTNFAASPQFAQVPSSWITLSVQCGSDTRRLAESNQHLERRLQASPSTSPSPAPPFTVIFTFTITAPGDADASQIAAAAAAVTAASGTSAATFTELLQAALPGAVVTNVAASVNGYVCGTSTTPACSSYFPASPNTAPLNIGAIIGGVIGGVAAFFLFVVLVVVCRKGYCGRRKAGTGDGLAVGAPKVDPDSSPAAAPKVSPQAVPQHIRAAAVYKPAV